MDIVDPGLGQRGLRAAFFEKPGLPRQRHRADVDHPLDPGLLQRGEELGHGRRLIADGEDVQVRLVANRLDIDPVGIEDEGGIIVGVIMRTKARGAIVASAGGQRGRVECVDRGAVRRP